MARRLDLTAVATAINPVLAHSSPAWESQTNVSQNWGIPGIYA
ncbi:hypothetical protein PN498_06975 [Oscillatoria sp. CS-180]|nr:hypothetical protein [Oscillatoria sp. CS-180]MDB9525725.1 hypothetical protein [Oscillatoria sp. CS-180]